MKKILLILSILVILLPVTALTKSNLALAASTDSLYQVNQKVCDRFETDVARLAAIMEELRRRKGVTETRVAFGGIETPIENADYWVTYAAEAVAYQRVQKFSSSSQLRSSLEVLKNKIIKTKGEVSEAL